MYNCITIGDIKLDTFVVIEDASIQCMLKMPECYLCIEYGKKIPVEAIDSQIAGSAANVAVGLSRMKSKTAVVSIMGKDQTYELALKRFNEEAVDTRYLLAKSNTQSSFSVVINYRGEKTILAAHTPYAYTLPKLAASEWIYVCELGTGYPALYRSLLRFIPINHTRLAVNPGAVQIQERKKILYDLMKKSSLLFLNLGEARAVTRLQGSMKPHHIVAATWQLNRKTVVVTDGRSGAYGFDGKTMYFSPIFPGKRVESTGAGDSFATGVLGAVMYDRSLKESLSWGAVNAASVVGQVGPQKGLLSALEIRKHLRSHPGFKVSVL